MKWIIIACLVFPFQNATYVVVNIQGKAVVQQKDLLITIKPGTRLNADEKIHFITENTVIRLASAQGTFIINKKSDPRITDPKSSAFWSVIKTEFLPTRNQGRMASRIGILSNELQAETEFGNFRDSSNAMLVLGNRAMEVNSNVFSDTTTSYFFLTYVFSGEKISKKIPWFYKNDKQYLLFDQRLFLIDGKPTGQTKITDGEISYYSAKRKVSTKLSRFNLAWYPPEDVATELCLIAAELGLPADPAKATQEKKDQLVAYVNVYLGKVDHSYFYSQYFTANTCNKK